MRGLLMAALAFGLMSGGCAWLGFGDDGSAETSTSSDVIEQEAIEETAPATAEKTTKTSSKSSTKTVKGKKSEAQIKAELDAMAKKLVAQSARTLLPNQANKEVKKTASGWIATYMHVDTEHVTTELRPGTNGTYVGFIRYQEERMQCEGKTKEAALKAPCRKVGARRLNELIRYDGRQWQD